MNSTKKIKIYVIVTVAAVLIISRLIFLTLYQDNFLTYDTFLRTLKSIKIRYDFSHFSLKEGDLSMYNSLINNEVKLDYKNSIPVLVYHGIPDSDEPGQFNITADSFKEQMFALKKAGYTTITADELYKYLKKEIVLPEKSILVTFDDGRIDSYKPADPVLKALDLKATMFLIGRYTFLGERTQYYLSTKQVKGMVSSGRWDVQAHSFDGHESYPIAPVIHEGHFFSHKHWIDSKNSLETDDEFKERIDNDLLKIKSSLEKLLNKPTESFAFPYGDFGQNNTNFKEAENINLEKAQKFYSLAFYQTSPNRRFTNNYVLDNNLDNEFFLVKRVIVDSAWTGIDLLDSLNKSTAKLLPYTDTFAQDNGWLLLWGNLGFDKNGLNLKTDEGETGGTILLDGTRLWKDYMVRISVFSVNQTSVYLWMRFQDDNNNAGCNFGDGFIHVEQTVDGVRTVARGVVDTNIQIPSTEFIIEGRVNGREIECILNDRFVVKSSFLDTKLDTGGIGFKAWNKNPDTANIFIKSLTAREYEQK